MGQKITANQSLVDIVYEDIKKQIVTGKLKPETKLIIRELCETYGISDTPIKQALNRLVSDGLVETMPRRGMQVKKVQLSEVLDALEARLMIELHAVPYALNSVKKGSSLVAELESNIKENRRIIEKIDDIDRYSKLTQKEMEISHDFHRIIVRSTGNKLIISMYNDLLNHSYLYYQSGISKKRRVKESIEEHEEILRSLAALDEERLRKSIITHLQATKEQVSILIKHMNTLK